MKKTAIILFMIVNLIQLHAEQNRSTEFNKLSYDIYMKNYQALNKIEKQHIDKKIAQIDRIYQRALDYNITQTKQYEERLYEAQKSIAMNLYLSSERDKIEIRHEEIEAYYQKHIRDYTSLHTYTIVTKTVEALTPIYKMLQESNTTLETFKMLAKKYSIHPRGKKGGDLGFIGYGTMVQPFGQETFSLKEKSYNVKPFKTTLGWHISYVESRETLPLEKIKAKIEYVLRMEKYKEWFSSL